MNDSLNSKVKTAIDRLKCFEPENEPYCVCYSGGKDSDTIRILANLANVKHELHYSLTTVDPPENVQYIKSIPNIIIDKARYKDGTHKTMWNLILSKSFPPTRIYRYCCSELKESMHPTMLCVTGVRWAESVNRKNNSSLISIFNSTKRFKNYLSDNDINFSVNKSGGIIMNYDNDDSNRIVQQCYRTSKTLINPIIDWTDSDVWDFLNYYNVHNPLYECGFKRIGCIGCPLGGTKNQIKEFRKYPKIYESYLRTFDKLSNFKSGEDCMYWWLHSFKHNRNQLTFDGFSNLDL